jgi:hypothetical protein
MESCISGRGETMGISWSGNETAGRDGLAVNPNSFLGHQPGSGW